jgi:hypothetical protein
MPVTIQYRQKGEHKKLPYVSPYVESASESESEPEEVEEDEYSIRVDLRKRQEPFSTKSADPSRNYLLERRFILKKNASSPRRDEDLVGGGEVSQYPPPVTPRQRTKDSEAKSPKTIRFEAINGAIVDPCDVEELSTFEPAPPEAVKFVKQGCGLYHRIQQQNGICDYSPTTHGRQDTETVSPKAVRFEDPSIDKRPPKTVRFEESTSDSRTRGRRHAAPVEISDDSESESENEKASGYQKALKAALLAGARLVWS